MSEDLKSHLKAVALALLVMGVILALPLVVGVWVPDVIAAPVNVLAEERSPEGETARVIQYWNRVDFYSTEFQYIGKSGIMDTLALDGDDSKSWRVPLVIDWEEMKAEVTLGGGRKRFVDLRAKEVRW